MRCVGKLSEILAHIFNRFEISFSKWNGTFNLSDIARRFAELNTCNEVAIYDITFVDSREIFW